MASFAAAEQEIDPMVPIVPPMDTGLILDATQESRMLNLACDRIDDLKAEMGLGASPMDCNGWMEKRQQNQAQYDNEWAWREALGGIFEFSNFSLNIAKRYCRLMAAKTTDDLVGSDPFFSCMPTETGNPELSKQAEWYVQEQFSQSKAKKNLKGAMKTALIRNECVVKLAWTENETVYTGRGIVAVGPLSYQVGVNPDGSPILRATAQGDPVLTPNGDYIYQRDNFIGDPQNPAIMRLEKEPMAAFAATPPTEQGAMPQIPGLNFVFFPALQQKLKGEGNKGLSVRELDYRDFLCPLNAATIHEADINVHLYDEHFDRLKTAYKAFGVSQPYVTGEYMSGEKQPKEGQGEEVQAMSRSLKIVNVAEVYMRLNPYEGSENDPGYESEIFMLIDVGARKLIWYDYLGNHMNKRPFEVIPGIELVQNRWYGNGVFQMLEHKQLYIDTQFNRVNHKSMKSSSLRFRITNAVAEWQAGQQVQFGDETVYNIQDPRYTKDNPPFFEWVPREVDEYAMELIKLMIQAGSTEVGIVGPDDGALSGLDSTQLATGIKSLERTGNLLMKFTEGEHSEAIEAILGQAVDIILERMDENMLVYRESTNQLLDLNRDEIRKLPQTIVLHLTRSRSTETIETARMVIQLVREYYEALTPEEQHYLRDEYIRQLKALEVPDGGKKLKEISDEQVQMWLVAQAKAANLQPKTSIATKYPDLARSEQVQLLEREGIRPATDTELADKDKQEVDLTGDKAGAEAEAKAKFAPKPAANGPKPKASK